MRKLILLSLLLVSCNGIKNTTDPEVTPAPEVLERQAEFESLNLISQEPTLTCSFSNPSVSGIDFTWTNTGVATRIVHGAAFKQYGNVWNCGMQEFFGWTNSIIVEPGSSKTVHLSGPGCYAQYDCSGSPQYNENACSYGSAGGPGLLIYKITNPTPLCVTSTPIPIPTPSPVICDQPVCP